jgi:hypothetical protein
LFFIPILCFHSVLLLLRAAFDIVPSSIKKSPCSVQRQAPLFLFPLLKSSCLLCSEYYSFISERWASLYVFPRFSVSLFSSTPTTFS